MASTRKNTAAKAEPIPTSAPSSTQGTGGTGQRGRADLQPDVQEAAEEHQHRDRDEPRRGALGGARQEQEERQHPADDEVAPEERRPAVVRPGEDEGDLLGKVRVPDQEILREPEVRPEGAEAEEQLPEVVQVALADLWQAPLPAQPEDREDGHRRPRQERAPDGVEAEDGARPVRLEAHQPVHRGEAQRVRSEQEEHRRQRHRPLGVLHLPIRVLGERLPAEHQGEGSPDAEEEQHPEPERREVEVHRLGRDERIRGRAGPGPGVDPPRTGEHREQRHHPHRVQGERLQHPLEADVEARVGDQEEAEERQRPQRSDRRQEPRREQGRHPPRGVEEEADREHHQARDRQRDEEGRRSRSAPRPGCVAHGFPPPCNCRM